jgi:hypothetical protein
MKVLKGILITLLTIILTALITCYLISFNLSSIITNYAEEDIVKPMMIKGTEETLTGMDFTLDAKDKEAIANFIKADKTVNKVADAYFNKTLEYIAGYRKLTDVTSDLKFSTIIIDHRKDIENIIGTKFDDEIFNEFISELDKQFDLNKVFQEEIKSTRTSISKNGILACKVYSIAINPKFKTISLIAMLVILVLIALLHWSYYKWVRALAIASIIAGCLNMIFSKILSLAFTSVSSSKSLSAVTTSTKPIYDLGLKVLFIGLIILIVYIIITIIIKNKKAKNSN